MITKFTGLARKLPGPLYKLAAQSYIDKEFPRHVFIETTANCQLSCSYCPREKRQENMDFALFCQIVDEASQYGPRSFSLHLFGEPLLYPRILDAVDYIKGKNRKHTILLTTNGVLLNRFNSSLDKVDRVIWSYRKNNFNEDSLRLLRKKGLVRLLIEETPKEEFDKWSKFPRVEVKHLHNYGGNINLDLLRGNKRGVQQEKLDETLLPKMRDSDTRYPCYHLWLAPAIRWNGEITICCNDPSGKESAGRYGEVNLKSFWDSARLKAIRESHLSGKYKGICAGCDSYKAYPDIFFKSQKHG